MNQNMKTREYHWNVKFYDVSEFEDLAAARRILVDRILLSFSCLWPCVDFVELDTTLSILLSLFNSMLVVMVGLNAVLHQPPFTSYVQQLLNHVFENLGKSHSLFQGNFIVLIKLQVRTQFSCHIAF